MRASALHGTLLGLALGACSSASPRPPELGNCTPTDGGSCSYVEGTDGGRVVGIVPPGNDGAAGSSVCTSQSTDALCLQCASARCCGPLDACGANTTCQNLAMCETSPTCIGSATCTSQCEHDYAGAVTQYGELTSCLALDCPVCSELGAGDPCAPQGISCNQGLTCTGLWCTKLCSDAADCVGLGADGANTLGLLNACIGSTNGNLCAPGCATDADCAAFPSTYCVATTSVDRLAVRICATSP